MKGLLTNFLEEQRIKKAVPYLKGTILDIGCGSGAVLQYISQQKYIGVDLDEEKINYLRKKFPKFEFMVTNIEKKEIKINEKFDTVLMLAVIEHLKNPNRILNNLRKLMKKDGALIITTPSKLGALVHTLGAKINLFSEKAVEEHQKIYSSIEMRNLLERNGFVLKKYSTFEFRLNQFFLAKPLKQD